MKDEKRVRIYRSWFYMIERCYDSKSYDYRWYGEKGIRVCDRWMDQTRIGRCSQGFQNFYENMEKDWFPGATIDRIDNNGNYCPESQNVNYLFNG